MNTKASVYSCRDQEEISSMSLEPCKRKSNLVKNHHWLTLKFSMMESPSAGDADQGCMVALVEPSGHQNMQERVETFA
jgi:hypothetical protein